MQASYLSLTHCGRSAIMRAPWLASPLDTNPRCKASQRSGSSAGQSSQYIDSLFTGNILGHKSDIADGSLRSEEFRTYNNIQGDYFIAPRFLDKVALHMGKNYLTDQLPSISVPLILGIWGAPPKSSSDSVHPRLCSKVG